jgi:hypothetical protein
MRMFFTLLMLFSYHVSFSQCPSGYVLFSNLQFLSGTAASGEVLNTVGPVPLSGGTPFPYNTIKDTDGTKLATDNMDVKDFTLSGSSIEGTLGNATIQLNPSGALARVRLSQGYDGTVSTNNPGSVTCNTFTLKFNNNIMVTDASFNLNSLNTAGIAWEYSVIQLLNASGSPFSDVSGPSFTPGSASQYVSAGVGYSGQAGMGNFVSASTGTVTGVGTNSTTSGTSGTNDAISSFGYSTVGLTTGTQIGGITMTTCLEDVRGTSDGATNFTSSLFDFTITGCIASSPAPVEFFDFLGKRISKGIELHFSTASETNNDFFTIERSADARTFENIGEIKGAGNSTSNISYTYTDENPLPGINYYRIKQTDYDGQYAYSDIKSVRYTSAGNLSITPRTTEGRLQVATDMEDYAVGIYNVAGQQVKSFKSLAYDQVISIDDLTAGLYYVKVHFGGEVETIKVVKM